MTERVHTVLLYSDDPQVRDRMRLAVGTRPASDLTVEFLDAADYAECIRLVDEYEVDLMLLDGEATPVAGSASPGRSRTTATTRRRPAW